MSKSKQHSLKLNRRTFLQTTALAAGAVAFGVPTLVRGQNLNSKLNIAAVGIGGHYLGRRSTRQFHRAGEVWQPALWQRGTFESYEGRPLVAEAASRADEILRTHEVTPLPDDVAAEIDAVLERFARSVGAPAARVPWREPTA